MRYIWYLVYPLYLVPRTRDLRARDIRTTKCFERDVRRPDHEEQDDKLWAWVRRTAQHELQKHFKKLFLRVRITISCRMNFDDYPLDAHTCQFQVGSCKSLTQKRATREVVFITDYDTKDMVTCTAKFIYDLKRQRSLQHFLTIEDLPEQFHTVVIPSGDPCHHHGQVYFDKEHIPWTMYPDQCLMRYLQPVEKNISTEPNGNCSAKVNL